MFGAIWRVSAVVLFAYLLGGVNGAIIISRLFCGYDVREKGSGNAGLTNFYRCFGATRLLPVLLIDLGKGILAPLCASWFMDGAACAEQVRAVAMLAVILGHMYPIYFGFRGGKGVLTGVGALLLLDWKLALIQLAVFVLVLALSRYVSLASIIAAGTLPLTAWLLGHDAFLLLFLALCGGMVVYLHHSNIHRLLLGTENKLKIKK